MNKWGYLIINLNDGELLGTDDPHTATEVSYMEGYVVIDTYTCHELFGGKVKEVINEANLNTF
jgi:hypothetical protein